MMTCINKRLISSFFPSIFHQAGLIQSDLKWFGSVTPQSHIKRLHRNKREARIHPVALLSTSVHCTLQESQPILSRSRNCWTGAERGGGVGARMGGQRQGKSHRDGQRVHVSDLATKMAQMGGRRYCWNLSKGPACLMLHITRILTKLNKQWGPHAAPHMSPLQRLCSPRLPLPLLFHLLFLLLLLPPKPRLRYGKLQCLKEESEQLLNSSMVCCIHKAWMSITNITLWYIAFCNSAPISFRSQEAMLRLNDRFE